MIFLKWRSLNPLLGRGKSGQVRRAKEHLPNSLKPLSLLSLCLPLSLYLSFFYLFLPMSLLLPLSVCLHFTSLCLSSFYLSLSDFLTLFVYLSLSLCLPFCVSLCLPYCFSFVYLYRSVYLSIYVSPPFCVSVFLSINLTSLSIFPSQWPILQNSIVVTNQ